jgi:PTS system fructose-specific IIC component
MIPSITRPAPDPDLRASPDDIPTGPPIRPQRVPTAARIRTWLTSGVSYAIPFVAGGGMLIALGYVLGGPSIRGAAPVTDGFDPTAPASWAALLVQLGTLTFGLLVPVLSAYTAHAIADRHALVPGLVGGMLAVQTGAGFLGGLVAGVLAGLVVHLLGRLRPPATVARIQPVLLIPLLGTLIVGAVMLLVIGAPLAALTSGFTAQLETLSAGSAVLLGATLGLMTALDLGGPVNKTAFTFAVTALSTGSPQGATIMAAVMAAGMTPPLAMALASTVRPGSFTAAERENSRASWLLGALYITEGAIPFAAADPVRVIPSLIAGSATTGALCTALGVSVGAPHGGLLALPLAGMPLAMVTAIAAGMLVSATAVVALKAIPSGTTTPPTATP